MTFKQIEKSFFEHFARYGVSIDEDEDMFKFESPEPSVILSFLKQSFIKYLKDECERLEGLTKTGSNGEGLPFENSPDIYGNQRVEAYKKGYNQAISDQITHITNQIKGLEV